MGQTCSSTGRLIDAAKDGDVEYLLQQVLQDMGLLTASQWLGAGDTIWHVAAEAGQLIVLKTLVHVLNQGPNGPADWKPLLSLGNSTVEITAKLVNQPDSRSQTPLHRACIGGHAPCAEFLLAHGANPWAGDVMGARNCLHYAASLGHVECMQVVLASGVPNPGELNAPNTPETSLVNIATLFGLTPLHYAAYANKVDVAALLIANGADICARSTHSSMGLISSPSRTTPLHLAAAEGHQDIARTLLAGYAETMSWPDSAAATAPRYRYDPRMLLNAVGVVPFHIARRRDDAVLAELLHPSLPLAFIFNNDDFVAGPLRMFGPPRLAVLAAQALHCKLLADVDLVLHPAGPTATPPAPPPHPAPASTPSLPPLKHAAPQPPSPPSAATTPPAIPTVSRSPSVAADPTPGPLEAPVPSNGNCHQLGDGGVLAGEGEAAAAGSRGPDPQPPTACNGEQHEQAPVEAEMLKGAEEAAGGLKGAEGASDAEGGRDQQQGGEGAEAVAGAASGVEGPVPEESGCASNGALASGAGVSEVGEGGGEAGRQEDNAEPAAAAAAVSAAGGRDESALEGRGGQEGAAKEGSEAGPGEQGAVEGGYAAPMAMSPSPFAAVQQPVEEAFAAAVGGQGAGVGGSGQVGGEARQADGAGSRQDPPRAPSLRHSGPTILEAMLSAPLPHHLPPELSKELAPTTRPQRRALRRAVTTLSRSAAEAPADDGATEWEQGAGVGGGDVRSGAAILLGQAAGGWDKAPQDMKQVTLGGSLSLILGRVREDSDAFRTEYRRLRLTMGVRATHLPSLLPAASLRGPAPEAAPAATPDAPQEAPEATPGPPTDSSTRSTQSGSSTRWPLRAVSFKRPPLPPPKDTPLPPTAPTADRSVSTHSAATTTTTAATITTTSGTTDTTAAAPSMAAGATEGQVAGVTLDASMARQLQRLASMPSARSLRRMMSGAGLATACSSGAELEEQEAAECEICFDADVAVEISECGHALCGACAKELCSLHHFRPAQCPYCRGLIVAFRPLSAAPRSAMA